MDKSQLDGGINDLIVLIRCNSAVDLRETAAVIKRGVLAHQAHVVLPLSLIHILFVILLILSFVQTKVSDKSND